MEIYSQNNEFSVTENTDTLSSDLNVNDSIISSTEKSDVVTSEMSTSQEMQSFMEEQEQLDSELDQPTTHKYVGGSTDNIIVEVDNVGRIITATLKPIRFKTVADFPVVGSDKLIYIDATENSLYSWDSAVGQYRKLTADVGEVENYDDTELRGMITKLEGDKADKTDLNNYYTKSQVDTAISNVEVDLSGYYTKTETDNVATQTLGSAKSYTDTKVAELIDSAPETLDTFKEIADAFKEDQEVLDALNSAIGNKVDKVEGKGLSTNDYTTAEKTKLAGIEEGANNYDDIEIRRSLFGKADKSDTYTKTEVDELITEAGGVIVDGVLSETSENPVQNKVVTNAFANTVTINTEQTITASKTLEYCGLKHITIANPSSSNGSIFSSFPSVYDRNGNNLGGMEFQYNNLNKWFGMALYAGVAHDVHHYPNKSLGIYKDANGNTITQAPTPSGSNNNEIATTGYVNESLGEYVTETELNAKGYLTSVPSQFVTETELENRLANFTSGATITIRRWS